ncbi:MAG: ParB/RepB/Spo0J family partition protein [Actinobacteria bacterium]|nr:MAG: ParB/RepB/Spo0J family partition protein [Actinomycetota bacterium]
MAKRGLGRGLSALIPAFKADPEQIVIEQVPLNQIKANFNQPRKDFDEEALSELALSIKQYGIMQPLVARRLDDSFQLIAGERRLRAAIKLGLSTVPVAVKESSDTESLEMALIENLQREDLNPIEEAQAYQYLIDNCRRSQAEVAKKIGKSRETVANTVRLLGLPEDVQQMLACQKLSVGHAKAILSLKTPKEQSAAALRIINNKLTVRQAESLSGATKKTPEEKQSPDSYKATALKLSSHLGTKVKVKKTADGGKIEIKFENEEELKRVFSLIVGDTNS